MLHYAISSAPAVFLLACFVLAITPGPAVLYLITRTLSQGRAAGLSSIGGVALGNLANAIVASLGLAAVLATSARALALMRLCGAAYLLYLGLRELRRAAAAAGANGVDSSPARDTSRPGARGRPFLEGFWVALLNPKTALFFAAFLPQFIDPRRPPLAQSLSLAAAFIVVAACTDTLYVLVAGNVGAGLVALRGAPRWGRCIAGLSYMALGVFVACTGARAGK